MLGDGNRRSARSGCTWLRRARPPGRSGPIPRRCNGSPPAAGRLRREPGRTSWAEVSKHDVQQWMAGLLGRYSAAYASNQFRALQQFFKWLAAEDEIPDPMAGLRPPHVPEVGRASCNKKKKKKR